MHIVTHIVTMLSSSIYYLAHILYPLVLAYALPQLNILMNIKKVNDHIVHTYEITLNFLHFHFLADKSRKFFRVDA